MAHQFYFNPYILDNLPAPQTGFDVVQDVSEPRLRMYITSRGVKTFFVRKRVNRKDKRIIILNLYFRKFHTSKSTHTFHGYLFFDIYNQIFLMF